MPPISRRRGFTLIEISIVIIIIGLVIGGVLVGRDLIQGANIRATVAQLEKYKTAINTFRTKYNALPGDIKKTNADKFGFFQLTGPNLVLEQAGVGNEDGEIEDCMPSYTQFCGERMTFWRHLAEAKLIPGAFSPDGFINAAHGGPVANMSTYMDWAKVFPSPKLRDTSFIVPISFRNIYNPGNQLVITAAYSISSAGPMFGSVSGYISGPESGWATTPSEGYQLDSKMDDGLPQSGRMTSGRIVGPQDCADTTVTPNVYKQSYTGLACNIQDRL